MKSPKKIFLFLLILASGFFCFKFWPNDLGEKQAIFGELKENFPEKQIKIALMGDIHLDFDNFSKALQIAKSKNVDFAVIMGDLTSLGEKGNLIEAKKRLDQSGLSYYVIPGNHDIWLGRKLKKDFFREVFGPSYQSFKKENYKFILVNNADGENGLDGTYNDNQKEQEKWLKQEVQECLSVDCFVFMHIPINHPNSLHIMGEENPLVASQAAELINLFVKYKVKQIYVGHLHYSSSYELQDLKTTVVGAITSKRNFQSPKFLIIELQKDLINREEIYLD